MRREQAPALPWWRFCGAFLHFRDLSRKKNEVGESRRRRSADGVFAYADVMRRQVAKHTEVIFSRHTGGG